MERCTGTPDQCTGALRRIAELPAEDVVRLEEVRFDGVDRNFQDFGESRYRETGAGIGGSQNLAPAPSTPPPCQAGPGDFSGGGMPAGNGSD